MEIPRWAGGAVNGREGPSPFLAPEINAGKDLSAPGKEFARILNKSGISFVLLENTTNRETMKTTQECTKSLIQKWIEAFRKYNGRRKARLASIDFGMPFEMHHLMHPLGPRD